MSASLSPLTWSLLGAILALGACTYALRRELQMALAWGATLTSAVMGAAAAALTATGAVELPQAISLGALIALCACIAEIDRRFHIIPDILVAGIVALALVAGALPDHAVAALALGGFFFLVHLGGAALRRRQVLGLGDVKLAAAIGLFLGLQTGLAAIAAAGAGTIVVLAISALRNRAQAAADCGAPFGVGLASSLAAFAVLGAWL